MTWTHRSRTIAALLLAAALAVTPLVVAAPRAEAAAPDVTGTETSLGVQMPGISGAVRSEQSAQGVLPDGRYLAYFASSGGPGTKARFFAMDLAGLLATQVAVPQGTDIRTLVYSPASRSVWFAANASATSYLYEWDGANLHQRATLSGHEVMRLGAAPDGSIYIGTFAPSNGRLFEWSGGRLQDHGQPFPGESYVRSLVVDSSSVWLSNYQSSAAKLVRFTRSSGARTAIATPTAFSGEWSALDMSRAGNYLFLRTVNSNRLFAYDVTTGTFTSFNDQVGRVHPNPEVANVVPYITDISPYGISPLFEGRYVYFQRARAGIMRIDLADGLKTVRVDRYNEIDNRASWTGASVFGPVSYAWLREVGGRAGYSLVTTTIESKIYINTPGQTAPVIHALPTEDVPSNIITLGSDSSGRVYSGGFDLPSGIGMHDPATGASSLLEGPQIEGFGRFGTSMIMGGYTGVATASAPVYAYSGSGQPVLRTYINNGQERPVAVQQVGSTMAIGTVPIKGELGGALSIWDPATNALTVKRNLIPDQSVVSLATHKGLVVGGSSNVGGTGSTPKPLDGKLFTYNPSTGALKTLTPPRFLSATFSFVAAITPDPSAPGRFWAISTGHLIQFQVADDGTLTLTKNLTTLPNTASPTGKGLGIEFVGNTLFATVDGGISAFDTTTGERTVVASATSGGPVVGLVKDAAQNLYYARGATLFRYAVDGVQPPGTVVGQTPIRAVAASGVAPGSVACTQIAGRFGVPTSATGAMVNVTTVAPTGPGYVVVYPDTASNGATPAPGGSTVNFEAGQDVANGTFVAVPANGKICWSTRGASAVGVLIDVSGYTLPGSGVSLQASRRVLDTRPGADHIGPVTGPVAPRQVYTVDVAGRAGVPTDADSVLLNVTVTGPTTSGNLRVFPGGQPVPSTSVVNFAAGKDKANGAVVDLVDGKISFYADSPVDARTSPVHVILDVVGWTSPSSTYTGLTRPTRIMDSRSTSRVGPFTGPLAAHTVYSLPVRGAGGVPAEATAVVLNVTAIGPTSGGNLRVYPDAAGTGLTRPPNASALNYITGRDVPNQLVVQLPENGRVNLYSDQPGSVQLAVDVVGYVVPKPES